MLRPPGRSLAAPGPNQPAPAFVLISSLAAHGPAGLDRPARESDPCRPLTAYGRSKLAAEALALAPDLPFRTAVLRPPALYGPRDRGFLWAVVYLLISAFYPVLKPSVFPHPVANAVVHGTLALAIWFIPPWLRARRHFAPRLLGEIYLPMIFPMFYTEMQYLGLIFFDFEKSLDPSLIRLEEWIFGMQPSLQWSQASGPGRGSTKRRSSPTSATTSWR